MTAYWKEEHVCLFVRKFVCIAEVRVLIYLTFFCLLKHVCLSVCVLVWVPVYIYVWQCVRLFVWLCVCHDGLQTALLSVSCKS